MCSAVHPHVCGVYGGSSSRFSYTPRFIPTCVGFTCSRPVIIIIMPGSSPRVWGLRVSISRIYGDCAVHPHVCGVYQAFFMISDRLYGSSPRVWGLLKSHHSSLALYRFIPTCVGFTVRHVVQFPAPHGSSPRVWGLHAPKSGRFFRFPVHPHVCGVYQGQSGEAMRSTRFIPTCVGFTFFRIFW